MALDAIVAYKHELLRTKAAHLNSLRTTVSQSDRSLRAALTRDHASFILEIKPASPSKGVIRPDVDILQIAKTYAPFAQAISVLADEKFFGGSLTNVQRVAASVQCPVLAKDVVVSPLQIFEARAFGAHAVLLMLSVLDDETYRECVNVARHLNMDYITEVHDESEMDRANFLEAPIIGINNRNLKTLAIDIATTERLAPRAHHNALVISESGINERSQIKRFAPIVHGFLIGSALMQALRIDIALRELIFGRVKICGLTNREDAFAAYDAGAIYGGLNFWHHSKRVVSVDEAMHIMEGVPLIFGGVFVNQNIDEIINTVKQLGLAFVQLHGDESDAFLLDLRNQLSPEVQIWRAVRVQDANSIPRTHTADRLLLDAFCAHDIGGTGTSFDWSLLCEHSPENFILAGGIKPENVARADEYGPFALDIASGVEDGDVRRKSREKINQLFFHLRPRGKS